MTGDREQTHGSGRPTRGRGFAFAIGAVVGVVIGLVIGPFGAAALGYNLPYVRISVPDAAETPAVAAAPSPQAAKPAPAKPPLAAAKGPTLALAAVTPVSLASAASGPAQAIPAPQGKVLTIGVFGDSMGDGLWQGLYRHLHQAGQVDVVRFSRASTGLTRYDYVDIQAQTTDQLAQRHVDVAVVMFGTNDQQGIVDHGKVYGFNTPGWQAAYGARIDALVALLRAQGAAVYWVGLPKMEKAGFDQRAGVLNAVLEARARALGVPFIPTVPVTVDETGQYDAYLATPGQDHRQLMRARDGVHMTPAGYLRIAAPVAERIRRDLAASGVGQTVAVSDPAHAPPATGQP